ncbi:MAG TPA: protein kinase [Vicinamibacterales bacterium]
MAGGSLATGTRLGPYEIVALIGRGGFGEVYRARDSRLGRDVAVKTVRGAMTREEVRRLDVEARATAALNHPNVVHVYDVGFESDLAFVVTELLDGETLRAVLGRGAVQPPVAMEYARQIADALAAAHAKGIVHRDLKPENIFVLPDGRIKVLDFGLAKQIVADADGALDTASVLTIAGEAVGTPAYFSPEQARAHAVDRRGDMFSFGVVLHEMLTGVSPFKRDTIADTVAAVIRDPAPPLPDDVIAGLPGIDRIVRRCLEKNPSDRFQSAADLRFALDAPASMPQAPRSKKKKKERKPRKRSVFAVIALSLLALRVGWSVGQRIIAPSRAHRTVESSVLDDERIAAVLPDARVSQKKTQAAGVEITASAGRIDEVVSLLGMAGALTGHRFADEPALNASTGRRASFDGQSAVRASLTVRGAETRALLETIASTIRWPLLVDPSIRGTVSIAMEDVPWDAIVGRCLESQPDLVVTRIGAVWVAGNRQRLADYQFMNDVAMWTWRPGRVSTSALAQALEPARSDRGLILPSARLNAVVILDSVESAPDYARILTAIEGASPRSLPADRRYTGAPMSVDFVEADVRSVIRSLGLASGLDVVLDPAVEYNRHPPVTLSVSNVPWDNLLDAILMWSSLGYVVDGKTVRIMPLPKERAEEKVEVVTLRREAPQFFEPFKRLVTSRGRMSIEPVTKTVSIRDVGHRADDVAKIIRQIDALTPAELSKRPHSP